MSRDCNRDKRKDTPEAVDYNKLWMEKMRKRAVAIALRRGSVSADDLRPYSSQLKELQGLTPSHPNSWGGLFKNSVFICVGTTVSQHPGNHRRRIYLWGVDPKNTGL